MATVELIHGGVKAATLRRVLQDAKEIVIVSAYTTPKGIVEVSRPILDCLKRGGHATLLLGLDRAIASPDLIRHLGALLKKGGGRLKVVLVVEEARAFLHAKIFAARKKGSAEILVGSFNLTGRGLASNHEFAARLIGNASSFFEDLRAFIDEIPDKRVLTLENVDELAVALTRPETENDPEVTEQRRKAAELRLAKILKALPQTITQIVREDQVATSIAALLRAGAFYNYQVDLEKLSVPSGLNKVYEAGLLSKEKLGDAGTFKLKRQNALSASAPLVPAHRRTQFRKLATSLGKAMGSFGFETPFGFWIPHVYVDQLAARVEQLRRLIPSGPAFESEVREFVAEHHAKLDETTEAILLEATKNGVEHPSRWRAVRDLTLSEIRGASSSASTSEWRGSQGENQAIDWIRSQLQSVKSKLDADLAIGKLRRIRAEVVRMPVEPLDLGAEDVRRLLECMVWAVAEDRGQKLTKRAVRALAVRLNGTPKSNFDSLQGLSEALLDGADGAEAGFFTLLGTPPYWEPSPGEDQRPDDDDDYVDSHDEHE